MKHNGKSLLSLALVLALGMLPGPALQARAADEDEVYTVSADAERVESEADAEPETPTLSEMIEQKQAEKTAASSDTEDAERNETAEPQGATPLRLLGATSGTLPTNQSSIVLDNDFIHNGDWTPTVNVTLDLNGHTLTIVDTSSQGGNGRICLDHRNISSVSHITVTDSVGGGNLVVGNFVQIDSGGATGQAIFELAGGTLTCQRAIDRGGNFSVFGVYYNAYGRAILNGGTITGCSGYGAATYGEGLYIGGEVNITGNSGGTDGNGNVFVYTGRTINITGDLGSSRIGVTTQTAPTADAPVVLTSGLSGHGDASNFFSDNDAYVVTLNDDGEAILAVKLAASVTSGGTTTEYTDFAAAVSAWSGAATGSTLQLLADVEWNSGNIEERNSKIGLAEKGHIYSN